MSSLILGQPIADRIHTDTKQRAALLLARGITPTLAVILVGNHRPSEMYVQKKAEAGKKVGVEVVIHRFPEEITTSELTQAIQKIQTETNPSGVIVQLPLPEAIDTSAILNAIQPALDVDCLTNENIGRLMMGTATIFPPTPMAACSILDELTIPLTGKNVTIAGMGALVGKPLTAILINRGASITTIDENTVNSAEKCTTADILITGVGKKDLIHGDMIPKNGIVIDMGIVFVDGKVYGDVNVTDALARGAMVTPTPGGTGPITVARLLQNVVLTAEQNNS